MTPKDQPVSPDQPIQTDDANTQGTCSRCGKMAWEHPVSGCAGFEPGECGGSGWIVAQNMAQGPCPGCPYCQPPASQPEGERWTIDVCGRCRKRVFVVGSDWKCEHCGHTLREVQEVEVVPASELTKAQEERGKWAALYEELCVAKEADVRAVQTRAEIAESRLQSERERHRELAERFAKQPCAKFPKDKQPCRWDCQRIRDDHRENAADYTAESNAAAEVLCDSCLARASLSDDGADDE